MKNKQIILITGGTGLLGLNLANYFSNEYIIYLGINNRNIKVSFAKTIFLSYNQPDELYNEIHKLSPHLIINTSGITSVEICEQNLELTTIVNTQLAKNFAIIAKKCNIKLIHISTDHLFDGKSQYSDELMPVNPLNNYAKSKFLAEQHVSAENDNALIIRTNFYSWGTTYRKSFSDIIIENLREKKTIFLFADVFYTPILIQTLSEYINKLLCLNAFGIYNTVSSERISKFTFGKLIASHFNLDSNLIKSISLNDITHLIDRPHDMSLSNNKLKNLLNLKIPSIEEQISILKKLEKDKRILEIKNL